MIVGVRREREVRQDRTQMQHGGQLDPQLTRRMNRDAQLKSLAHRGSLHAGAHAAPKGGVEQDHIHSRVEDVGGELLEVDHDGVGGEGNAHHLAGAAHPV